MKACGKKTSKKEKEKRRGQTGLVTKESISKERKKDLDYSIGEMVRYMKKRSLIITFMEEDITSGVIEENMKVNGRITKWKEVEYLLGLMEGSIVENMFKTRRKVMEYLNGQMEGSIEVIGVKESSILKESFSILMRIFGEKEYGMKVKE